MRIAFFHELPRTTGSRKAVNKIAQHFSKKNIVDLYYVDRANTYSANTVFKKIYFYKFVPVVWHGGNPRARLYRDTVELVKLFFLHWKIAKDIRNKKYDAVFIHGSYLTESPFLLFFSGFFKIYYAHAPNYTLIYEKVMGTPKSDPIRFLYESVNRYIRKLIDKVNVRSADLILANSNYTRKKILSFYGKKSLVSYLGVDVSIYKPLKSRKIYDFLYVGSYHPVDGYDLLNKVLQKTKKISGKVLAIEDEWINDDFEMAKLYNNAKTVLCLSHGEPFGLVGIEAMACGVPVIAIDEAGYKETVIQGKTGMLIKRSEKDLRMALLSLLRNEKKRQKLSLAARQNALKNWAWEKVSLDMENIIKRRIKT